MAQTNKIYHTCHCISRDFTLDEYSEFVKSTNSNQAVLDELGFQWNVHDICINPHIAKIIDEAGHSLDIETARTRDGWVYGYYHFGLEKDCGGGSGGCRFSDAKYPTEDSAIVAALELFKSRENLLPKYRKAITEEIFNRKCTQLTLF